MQPGTVGRLPDLVATQAERVPGAADLAREGQAVGVEAGEVVRAAVGLDGAFDDVPWLVGPNRHGDREQDQRGKDATHGTTPGGATTGLIGFAGAVGLWDRFPTCPLAADRLETCPTKRTPSPNP